MSHTKHFCGGISFFSVLSHKNTKAGAFIPLKTPLPKFFCVMRFYEFLNFVNKTLSSPVVNAVFYTILRAPHCINSAIPAMAPPIETDFFKKTRRCFKRRFFSSFFTYFPLFRQIFYVFVHNSVDNSAFRWITFAFFKPAAVFKRKFSHVFSRGGAKFRTTLKTFAFCNGLLYN